MCQYVPDAFLLMHAAFAVLFKSIIAVRDNTQSRNFIFLQNEGYTAVRIIRWVAGPFTFASFFIILQINVNGHKVLCLHV